MWEPPSHSWSWHFPHAELLLSPCTKVWPPLSMLPSITHVLRAPQPVCICAIVGAHATPWMYNLSLRLGNALWYVSDNISFTGPLCAYRMIHYVGCKCLQPIDRVGPPPVSKEIHSSVLLLHHTLVLALSWRNLALRPRASLPEKFWILFFMVVWKKGALEMALEKLGDWNDTLTVLLGLWTAVSKASWMKDKLNSFFPMSHLSGEKA